MKRIAKFEKVSPEQFRQAYTGDDAESVYNAIKLPRRATSGSAGYDFFAPFEITLKAGETVKIPTGIRVKIEDGWFLTLYPRSDYYNAENEGHIMVKLTNDTREGKTVQIAAGAGFVQGIFLEYGITEDDDADGERVGGFGSTDNSL